MMHMHGVRAQELTSRSTGVALDRLVGVPVDVGKSTAMVMVIDFTGARLAAPFEFALDRAGVDRLVARVRAVLPDEAALVRARGGGVRPLSKHSEERIGALVPTTCYKVLTSVPGWGPVRVGGYAAGVGDLSRWPSHRQV